MPVSNEWDDIKQHATCVLPITHMFISIIGREKRWFSQTRERQHGYMETALFGMTPIKIMSLRMRNFATVDTDRMRSTNTIPLLLEGAATVIATGAAVIRRRLVS